MPTVVVLAINRDRVLTCRSMVQIGAPVVVNIPAAQSGILDLPTGNNTIAVIKRVTHVTPPGQLRRDVLQGDNVLALDILVRRLNFLRGTLGNDVYIKKEIEWKVSDGNYPADRYSCLFVREQPPMPPGFIKGKIENIPGAVPPQLEADNVAAEREFREETGVRGIDPGRFIPLRVAGNVHIVRLDLTDAEAAQIIPSWTRLTIIREIANLQWQPINAVLANRLNYNQESQQAFQDLAAIALPPPPPPVAPAVVYAPGAGQPAPPAFVQPANWPTGLHFIEPQRQGAGNLLETIRQYKERLQQVIGRELTLNEQRSLNPILRGFGLAAAGGRRTIRRKKSRRSKKRGTLKRGVRR
jgi:hypothetical protein